MKPLILSLILFFTLLALTGPIFVQAQGTDCPAGYICLDNPLKQDTVNDVVNAVADLLATLAIPLGIIMIVWGGIQIMTGMTTGEKESKVVQGKKTIMWAVIGVAIVLLARALTGFVTEIIGKK